MNKKRGIDPIAVGQKTQAVAEKTTEQLVRGGLAVTFAGIGAGWGIMKSAGRTLVQVANDQFPQLREAFVTEDEQAALPEGK
jgi:F0F1-type ATP synthase membrane subunit c/vacuolar-type H+-ATPase subunit K